MSDSPTPGCRRLRYDEDRAIEIGRATRGVERILIAHGAFEERGHLFVADELATIGLSQAVEDSRALVGGHPITARRYRASIERSDSTASSCSLLAARTPYAQRSASRMTSLRVHDPTIPWTRGADPRSSHLARQRRLAHQILVHRVRRLPAFADRPDDQRLAAAHVAGRKHFWVRGLVVVGRWP